MSVPRRRTAWFAVLLLPLLTIACGRSETPADESSDAMVVNTAIARIGDLRDVANAPGVIVPSRAADLTVYAPDVAEIVELPKKIDDTVEIGDVLVRFDIASLAQELAARELEVVEAASRVERTQAEMTRQTSFFERGLIPRNAYDAARLDHSAAETNLAAAKSRLEGLKASDTRSVVRATFPGVVTEIWHAVGDAVRPDTTDPILRVVDPTRVQVAVQLPFSQIARIVPGQSAVVRAIAGALDEPATVVSATQSFDPSMPTGEIRLAFENPATLPIDTPVSVELVIDRRNQVLIVPSSTVGRDDIGSFVMIAGTDGLAHRRDVQLGLVTPQFTQIVSGVDEDDEIVILTEYDEVTDGTPIVVGR